MKKSLLWDRKPISYLIEFDENIKPADMFKELKNYNIKNRCKNVFIVEELS